MRFFFQFITWAFMPILMPIYGLLLVMFVPSEPIHIGLNNSLFYFPLRNKVIILIYFLVLTVIIPGLIYIIMQIQVLLMLQIVNFLLKKLPNITKIELKIFPNMKKV